MARGVAMNLETKEKIAIDYLSGLSSNKCAKIHNVGQKSVLKALKLLNIPRRDPTTANRTYSFDFNYFKIIDTEKKAYFLGLLLADGCNIGNGFVLDLQKQDEYIINSLMEDMKFYGKTMTVPAKSKNHKIRTRLQITSKELSKDLSKNGVVPRKTHVADFPTTIPKNLIHHFIRGYFDGDGCITIALPTNRKAPRATFSIVGNDLLISKIQKILIENCSLNNLKISQHKQSKQNIVVVRYSGINQVIKIRDYLYKDATIFITRKRDKFFSLNRTYNKNKVL